MNNAPQLIDLNQTIFVTITDETQDSVTYEKQMTLAELFADVFPDFEPEIVDAIPTSWLNYQIEFAKKEGFKEPLDAYQFVKDSWDNTKAARLASKATDKQTETETSPYECNDCEHFDVMTGQCDSDKELHHPLEEACDEFVSWEDEHD